MMSRKSRFFSHCQHFLRNDCIRVFQRRKVSILPSCYSASNEWKLSPSKLLPRSYVALSHGLKSSPNTIHSTHIHNSTLNDGQIGFTTLHSSKKLIHTSTCREKKSSDKYGVSGGTENDERSANERSQFLNNKWEVLNLDEVVEFLKEENAQDIVVIEVPKEMCYVDYFIVVTAMSGRHLASMAEIMNKLYKERRRGRQPFAIIEGKRISEEWQCIDIGNMVIHFMLEGVRQEYQLEKLWLLGHKHDDLLLEKPSEEDILKRISMQGLNLMSMDQDTVSALGDLYNEVSPWETDPDDLEDAISELSLTDTENERSDRMQRKHTPGKESDLDDDYAFLV